MTADLQQLLTSGFGDISNLVAPYLDGGILNYLFKPVTENITNNTLLNLRTDWSGQILYILQNILFSPVQSLEVMNVLATYNPTLGNPYLNARANPRLVVAIVVTGCLLILTALGFLITAIVISCCCWPWEPRRPKKAFMTTGQHPKSPNTLRRSLSVGSIRAQLHSVQPRTLEWVRNASIASTISSDLYVNFPTICARVEQPSLGESRKLSMTSDTIVSDLSTIPNGFANSTTLIPPTRNQIKAHKLRNKHAVSHICLFLWTIIFIGISIGLLVLSLYAMDSVNQQTNPVLSTSSSPGGLEALVFEIIGRIQNYLQMVRDQGYLETKKTFANVDLLLQNGLNDAAQGIMTKLVYIYKFGAVFDSVDHLTLSLEEIINSTTFIAEQNKRIMQSVGLYSGELKAYQNVLNSTFEHICTNMGQVVELTTCRRLQAESAALIINVNANNIEFATSVSLDEVMKQLNFNLSSLTTEVDKVRSFLQSKTVEIIQKMSKELNVTANFLEVLNIWNLFQTQVVDQFKEQINLKEATLENNLLIAAYSITSIGYSLLVLLLIVMIILMIHFILDCTNAIDRKLYRLDDKAIYYAEEMDQSHLITIYIKPGNSIAELKLPQYKCVKQTGRSQRKCASIFLSFFNIFLFIFLVLFVIVVPVMSLVNTELCRYVNSLSGARLFDQVLALFLQYQWPNLLTSQNLPNEVLQLLVVQPPINVLTAIRYDCNPQLDNGLHYGLLEKLNRTNILNFNPILTGPELTAKIKSNEDFLVREITRVNFQSFFPKELPNLADLAKNITKYLDNQDYEPSIFELNKFVSPMRTIETYVQEVRNFASQNPQRQILDVVCGSIMNSLPIYKDYRASVSRMIGCFEALQRNRGLTAKINLILTQLDEAKKVVTDPQLVEQPIRPVYRDATGHLLAQMNASLIVQFDSLFRILIPCGELYDMVQLTMTVTCNQSTSLINRFGMYSLLMALTNFVFILLIYMFVHHSCRTREQSIRHWLDALPVYETVRLCYKVWLGKIKVKLNP